MAINNTQSAGNLRRVDTGNLTHRICKSAENGRCVSNQHTKSASVLRIEVINNQHNHCKQQVQVVSRESSRTRQRTGIGSQQRISKNMAKNRYR